MSPGPRAAAVAGTALAEVVGARSLLAVCAHPDDESFGLGAVLDALARAGVSVSVLSFTHGEMSTLHGLGRPGEETGGLGAVRSAELAAAAAALGAEGVLLLDHPDGGLDEVRLEVLVDEVARYAGERRAEALLAFDVGGVTGHPDHVRATEAALAAGERLGVGVLGWVVPASVAEALNSEFGTAFGGRRAHEVDVVAAVERTVQGRAIACHASQSSANPVLWRRLELQGGTEWLAWLRRPPG